MIVKLETNDSPLTDSNKPKISSRKKKTNQAVATSWTFQHYRSQTVKKRKVMQFNKVISVGYPLVSLPLGLYNVISWKACKVWIIALQFCLLKPIQMSVKSVVIGT